MVLGSSSGCLLVLFVLFVYGGEVIYGLTSWHPKCIQIVIRFLYVQLERTPKHGKENHDPLSSGVTKDQMALANHLLNLGSLENLVASLLVNF